MKKNIKRSKEEKINVPRLILRIVVVAIILGLMVFAIKIAPNYARDEFANVTNLVINNNNITRNVKNNIIIEDNTIYLSTGDMQNFLDEFLLLSYLESVSKSVTNLAILLASVAITFKNLFSVSLSYSPSSKVSAYPIIDVIGVFNSCDTSATNSFCILSNFACSVISWITAITPSGLSVSFLNGAKNTFT